MPLIVLCVVFIFPCRELGMQVKARMVCHAWLSDAFEILCSSIRKAERETAEAQDLIELQKPSLAQCLQE